MFMFKNAGKIQKFLNIRSVRTTLKINYRIECRFVVLLKTIKNSSFFLFILLHSVMQIFHHLKQLNRVAPTHPVEMN